MKYKSLTLHLIVSILLSIILTACSQGNIDTLEPQSLPKEKNSQVIKTQEKDWRQVTVKHYNFEGGFYGLTSIKGVKLLPINLDKKYQLSGTVLKVKGKELKDMITIQQWGQPFQITDVELVTSGHSVLDKSY